VVRNPASRAARTFGTPRARPSVIRFVGEIISELRKVNWPPRQEAWRLTTLVIVVSIVIGAVLGLIDMGFSRIFAIIAGN